MRQKIVIELEGEAPVVEDVADAVRESTIREAVNYHLRELRDFSICRGILPDEICDEIRIPEFLNREGTIRQIRDETGETPSGKEAVQDV